MTFHPVVEFSPAHELVLSLTSFLYRKGHKLLDLGPSWAAAVQHQLDPHFAAELTDLDQPPHLHQLHLLPYLSPEKESVDSFLAWLKGLTPGRLHELLAPTVLETNPALPADLGAMRDRFVSILTRWHEQYLRSVDPAVLSQLTTDARAKRELAAKLSPTELVEQATAGIVLEPQGVNIDTVVLVPHYHHRPSNMSLVYRNLLLLRYPADDMPAADAQQPPARLLRITRAIADESRLRILRFITGATEPVSFTDVVRHTGLALSTVHHHMLALRAAGLVRVHETLTGQNNIRYSIRPAGVHEMGARLSDYLKGE